MISGEGLISVPWSSSKKCRLVKSFSSTQPHMVTVNTRNRNMYVCDEKCPMFKGYSICAHVIATAEDNGDFFDSITCKPNLTAIASCDMPNGSGRRGVKPSTSEVVLLFQLKQLKLDPHVHAFGRVRLSQLS